MLTVIGLGIGALIIVVYFAILFPLPNIAALAIIPLAAAVILLYWSVSIQDFLENDLPFLVVLLIEKILARTVLIQRT